MYQSNRNEEMLGFEFFFFFAALEPSLLLVMRLLPLAMIFDSGKGCFKVDLILKTLNPKP